MIELVDIVRLGKNPQNHLAAIHGHKLILDVLQIPGAQRNPLGRFNVRVLPCHPVTLSVFTSVNIVAV